MGKVIVYNPPSLGNKDDHIVAPLIEGTVTAMAILNNIEEHLHSASRVFPELADPVTLTKAAGVWAAFPTPTQIIPANTVDEDFDIHFAMLSDTSAAGQYVLKLYAGAVGSEVVIAAQSFFRTAATFFEGSLPVMTKLIPANTRISAAISSDNATANTCRLKLYYHVY